MQSSVSRCPVTPYSKDCLYAIEQLSRYQRIKRSPCRSPSGHFHGAPVDRLPQQLGPALCSDPISLAGSQPQSLHLVGNRLDRGALGGHAEGLAHKIGTIGIRNQHGSARRVPTVQVSQGGTERPAAMRRGGLHPSQHAVGTHVVVELRGRREDRLDESTGRVVLDKLRGAPMPSSPRSEGRATNPVPLFPASACGTAR